MHKSFYKLDCEPFAIEPDPTFLWMGEKYKEALSVLRYGILDNKGFLLLTGESGVGKTILLHALTESLPPEVQSAIIPNPDVPKMEMFNIISRGFGLGKEYTSKVEFMLDFSTFLQEGHDNNKKMLLIVDSAHLLDQENLEELRLLSNIEQADAKLLHIFFSAQPLFNTTLTRPRNSAIRQRLNLTHTIEPLTAQETSDYIEHRLSVAGVESRILTEKAIRSVQHFSGGIPKNINMICHHLLVEGTRQGRRIVDQGAVQECMSKYAHSEGFNQMDSAARGSMQGADHQKKRFNPWALVIGALALFILGIGYLFWSPRGQEMWANVKNNVKTASSQVAVNSTPSPTTSVDSSANATGGIASQAVVPPINKTDADNSAAEESTAATVTISPTTGLATIQPSAQSDANGANRQVADPASQQDEEEIIVAPKQKAHNASQTAKASPGKSVNLPQLKTILPLQANSRALSGDGDAALANFVDKFKKAGQGKIEVRGYVSSNNESRKNTQLSTQRAEAVQAMLIKAGVDRSLIVVHGMGIQNPLASNDTPEGRDKNRRVELEIIP